MDLKQSELFQHLKSIVCPACRGALVWAPSVATCATCGRTYAVVDDIPVLLVEGTSAGHDEIAEHWSHDHKRQQSRYFDRDEASEFEISRPIKTPALYEWLLRERFRRATAPIRRDLRGLTALSVCGGSGMDAHFLAESGALVISADISFGAAKRARTRSMRFGLKLTSIVADVERLPFANCSMDLVYVHDGLHHLEKPEYGLAEMGRVARRWVAVTEPARGALTQCAVRIGVALDREDSGNRVARLDIQEIESALRAAGLREMYADRYLMYYKHHPGRLFQALSSSVALPLVVFAWRLVNGLVGRFGNKLAVISRRIESR